MDKKFRNVVIKSSDAGRLPKKHNAERRGSLKFRNNIVVLYFPFYFSMFALLIYLDPFVFADISSLLIRKIVNLKRLLSVVGLKLLTKYSYSRLSRDHKSGDISLLVASSSLSRQILNVSL